jgi:hypothetical protein
MLPDLAPVLASVLGPNPMIIVYPGGIPDALPVTAGGVPAVLLLGTVSHADAASPEDHQTLAPSVVTTSAASPQRLVTPDGDPAAECSALTSKGARRRVVATPASKAQAIFAEEGDPALDRETWVKRTGVSRRCLDRAIKLGLIATTRQGHGRANRRDFAKASDVAGVLATIEAVRHGRVPPPEWYEAVIRPFKSSDAVAA